MQTDSRNAWRLRRFETRTQRVNSVIHVLLHNCPPSLMSQSLPPLFVGSGSRDYYPSYFEKHPPPPLKQDKILPMGLWDPWSAQYCICIINVHAVQLGYDCLVIPYNIYIICHFTATRLRYTLLII